MGTTEATSGEEASASDARVPWGRVRGRMPAAVALLVAVLTACARNTEPHGGEEARRRTETPADETFCDLVPRADAIEILGPSTTAQPTTPGDGSIGGCTWFRSGPTSHSVEITVAEGESTAEEFRSASRRIAEASKLTAEEVAGIGDAATYLPLPGAGQLRVHVSGATLSIVAVGADDPRGTAVAFAREAVPRVRAARRTGTNEDPAVDD